MDNEKEKEKEKNTLKSEHTIDNWTSAQPPPPLSSSVSPNIVYPSNCSCGRRLGIDCANATCCNDYPNRYIYDYDYLLRPTVYTHPHGFEVGYRGPSGPIKENHGGGGHHGGHGGHHGGDRGHQEDRD